MDTQSHAQLKEYEITKDLSVCDSSETNLKNFCDKRHAKNATKRKATKN